MNAPQELKITAGEDVAHRYGLEQARMTLDAGWLGRIFGSSANAPTNITGFILVIFAITVVYLIVFRMNEPASEALKTVIPVITLALGYLFGRKT